jgi:hypothetical protein
MKYTASILPSQIYTAESKTNFLNLLADHNLEVIGFRPPLRGECFIPVNKGFFDLVSTANGLLESPRFIVRERKAKEDWAAAWE